MNQMNLVILNDWFLYDTDTILLEDGCVEIPKERTERFIAMGIEKSKPSEDLEISDLINVVVLVKGSDEQYYTTKIEHYPEDVLTPNNIKYETTLRLIEDDESIENTLIENIYATSDSRFEYSLIIDRFIDSFSHKKEFCSIYEKYLVYRLSVGYQIWENADKSIDVDSFLWVRCQVGYMSHYTSCNNEDIVEVEDAILQYQICAEDLIKVRAFQPIYFKPYKGKVAIDGIKVLLED